MLSPFGVSWGNELSEADDGRLADTGQSDYDLQPSSQSDSYRRGCDYLCHFVAFMLCFLQSQRVSMGVPFCMRIVSVNLRKRLRITKKLVESWLNELDCDLLVVQEPWDRRRTQAIELHGYRSVGGNTSVYSWLVHDFELAERSLPGKFWQRIDFGCLAVYNVYLPAKSRAGRVEALHGLRREVSRGKDRLLIILGDFNLAPEPEDGVYRQQISKWTGKAERAAFKGLLSDARLIDMTSRDRVGHTEYTFERNSGGLQSAFRCDLALVSHNLASLVTVHYDHRVRVLPMAFTDHSSMIVEVPIDSLTPKKVCPSERS